MAAPSEKFLPLLIALFLLGLGWNLAYVAGSTLLADQLAPEERAKAQGFNDLLLNLGSAASQVGSGVVYAFGGYLVMGVSAAIMATVPLIAALWWRKVVAQKQNNDQ
jgi:MFS family permease